MLFYLKRGVLTCIVVLHIVWLRHSFSHGYDTCCGLAVIGYMNDFNSVSTYPVIDKSHALLVYFQYNVAPHYSWACQSVEMTSFFSRV